MSFQIFFIVFLINLKIVQNRRLLGLVQRRRSYIYTDLLFEITWEKNIFSLLIRYINKISITMKSLYFLLCACLLAGQARSQDVVNLPEAIKKGWVQSVMQGNPTSAHYIKPLRITLTNKHNKLLTLKLEAGSYFVSEPADFQDIVNTSSLITSLKPQEQKTVQVYGVCTEASNKAPNESTSYTIGEATKPSYLAYAQFVEKEGIYGTSEAQHGMWAISDDKPIEEIYGHTDADKTGKKVREFVGKLLNKPLPKVEDMAQHYSVQIDGRSFTKKNTFNVGHCRIF
jgi:hypothetical protein